MKTKKTQRQKSEAKNSASAENQQGLDRRSFVKILPALGVAVAAGTNLSIPTRAQTPTPTPSPSPSPSPTPMRITKDMLHQAEKLFGIEFSDAQEAMALRDVNRNLDSYETVRKIDVPLDTEPAIAFHPAPARKQLYAGKGKFRFGKVELPPFKTVEDLAFATVPQLAQLLRTRKISSTELTKMYLARLKRFGPKLLCVVTLTEDLALKQADAADAEIKRGKYRGPLHGIPWGAKDLFATKGIKTTWGAEPYRDQVVDYDSTVVERLRIQAQCSWQNFRWGRWRKGRNGSAESLVIPGCPMRHARDPAALPRVPPRRLLPVWSGFPSVRKHWALSSRHLQGAA